MANTKEFELYKPFVVSFSNIPFVCNGITKNANDFMIKGVSCFSYLILEHQKRLTSLKNTVHYSFTSVDFLEENFSNSRVVEDRWNQVCDFLEQHFSFLKNVQYENKEHLFVYSTFLDQLATDCFKYIGFKTPNVKDYLKAFDEIDLLADYKNITRKQVLFYKNKLLTTLSFEKPDIYCQMLFHRKVS